MRLRGVVQVSMSRARLITAVCLVIAVTGTAGCGTTAATASLAESPAEGSSVAASAGSSEAEGPNRLSVDHDTFALAAAHQEANEIAVGRNEQQVSGWPSGIKAVTASTQSGKVTDSNVGHTCESGTIISVRLFGAFHTTTTGMATGTGTSSPDNTVREIDLSVDAKTGLTCLIAVRVEPVPQSPAESVLYSR